MALRRLHPHLSAGWRALVHPQPPALLLRAKLQVWQWHYQAGTVLLLRPARPGATAVLARVLDTTPIRCPEPPDETPRSRCLVRWRDPARPDKVGEEELLLENGHAIRCADPAAWAEPAFYAVQVPERLWDHTRELPELPGALQPMPPRTVAELRTALGVPDPRVHVAHDPLVVRACAEAGLPPYVVTARDAELGASPGHALRRPAEAHAVTVAPAVPVVEKPVGRKKRPQLGWDF